MSGSTSPTTGRIYGKKRVCEIWEFPRSTLYSQKSREPFPKNRPGPKPKIPDQQLGERIGQDLKASPFKGEGHRKVWARLKRRGVRVSRNRILRVMRERKWLSPHRSPKGVKRAHNGHIITERPNDMWGTDGVKIETAQEGWIWLFTVIDHWNSECLGWYATKKGDRHAALEAIGRALRYEFGVLQDSIAHGVKLRMDHGSQYISDELLRQIKRWGLKKSFAFVAQPQTNGVSERFNRTLKEQVVYGRIFETVDDVRSAMERFVEEYNRSWILEKLGYQSPLEAKAAWAKEEVA